MKTRSDAQVGEQRGPTRPLPGRIPADHPLVEALRAAIRNPQRAELFRLLRALRAGRIPPRGARPDGDYRTNPRRARHSSSNDS